MGAGLNGKLNDRMLAERIKIAVAALIAVGGLVAFYALVDKQPLVVRLAALLGAFGLAVVVMWFTESGRTFAAFSRESWEEAKRVVWPTRKETLQTTGVVFAFVFIMAVFLWMVDAGLLWVTQKLLGTGG
jgi:preprotein translocase subunit SecE